MGTADADARSEQARNAANARWTGQVVSRAVQTIVERAGELEPGQLADLRAVTEQQKGGDNA